MALLPLNPLGPSLTLTPRLNADFFWECPTCRRPFPRPDAAAPLVRCATFHLGRTVPVALAVDDRALKPPLTASACPSRATGHYAQVPNLSPNAGTPTPKRPPGPPFSGFPICWKSARRDPSPTCLTELRWFYERRNVEKARRDLKLASQMSSARSQTKERTKRMRSRLVEKMSEFFFYGLMKIQTDCSRSEQSRSSIEVSANDFEVWII